MGFDEIGGGRGEVLGKPLEFFVDENFSICMVVIALNDSIGDNFAMGKAFFHIF